LDFNILAGTPLGLHSSVDQINIYQTICMSQLSRFGLM
jgi:hypothetical protein